MENEKDGSDMREAFVLDEIIVLIHYASERGVDPENKILAPLNQALCDYKSLPEDQKGEKAAEILKFYSALTKLTYPVNGRTLIDTDNIRSHLRWLFVYTFAFLILALGNEVLTGWFNDIVPPEEGPLLGFINVHRYVLDPLSPFFWGGLGACVYLLKRLSDLAADRSFDRKQLKGWQTRIWLGAILGAMVQYLYDPTGLTENATPLDAKALAFLTGVGVRVVYGAIEKTVEVLADKLNLGAVRREKAQFEMVRKFLSQQLSQTDPEKESQKRKCLLDLIDQLEKP